MREVQRKSPWPVYIAAAVFALYALIFPLYAAWHFLIAAVVTAAAWLAADRFFKPVTEYIAEDEPDPEPADPGAAEVFRTAQDAKAQLTALAASIAEDAITERVSQLISLSDRIAADTNDDPSDVRQIRRFQQYFLPTTIALLQSYARVRAQVASGEELASARERILEMLDAEAGAFQKQLDALYQNDFLSIDADIQVMQRLMEREGLLPQDELHELLRTAQSAQ